MKNPNAVPSTKHTCGGPVFGKKTPGCPRCDELIAGAPPIVWRDARAARLAASSIAALKSHSCAVSGCGPVCTFGDW